MKELMKMTYKEHMKELKKIQNECKKHHYCDGCKYYTISGCALQHIPEEWKLEYLYSYTEGGADNGK